MRTARRQAARLQTYKYEIMIREEFSDHALNSSLTKFRFEPFAVTKAALRSSVAKMIEGQGAS